MCYLVEKAFTARAEIIFSRHETSLRYVYETTDVHKLEWREVELLSHKKRS